MFKNKIGVGDKKQRIEKSDALRLAFFVGVFAIIVFLLFWFLGYRGLTGGYHALGVGDSVRLENITFTIMSNVNIRTPGYSGRVDVIKIEISGPAVLADDRNLWFRFGEADTRVAYVVTRKIDFTALPVGSIFYRDGLIFRIDQLGSYVVRDRLTFYTFGSIPMYVGRGSIFRYAPINFRGSKEANFPVNVTIVLFEPYLQHEGKSGIVWRGTDTWRITATPFFYTYGLSKVFSHVEYCPPTSYFNKCNFVEVGQVSAQGSVYASNTRNQVLLRYAYNATRR